VNEPASIVCDGASLVISLVDLFKGLRLDNLVLLVTKDHESWSEEVPYTAFTFTLVSIAELENHDVPEAQN